MQVGFARADAGFCKFANCREDIGTGVVGKIEKRTYSRAEGKAFVSFFNDVLVMIIHWSVVFAERVVRWVWSFAFREFQIEIVALKGV
jgi:hypothetical protein